MNSHIESRRIGFTSFKTSLGRKKPFSAFCLECGHVWTEEEKAAKSGYTQHLVEQHGYLQEGAQVFKRHWCVACPEDKKKPGLYRVGTDHYCREHKDLGNARLQKRNEYLEEKASVIDQARKERERLFAQRDHLHSAKKIRRG